MLVRVFTFAALSFLAAKVVAYRQPWEYVEALKAFHEVQVNPKRAVEQGRSDLLADDCVGRVDITTTFEGQELNTEYLFGLFYQISQENVTSIIGYPSHIEIQSLVVQPPVVYFSVIVQLAYPTVNATVPVQLDVVKAWRDDEDGLKIISYDASLRRWPQTYNYIVNLVAAAIAKEMNETYDATTNVTAMFARKAAQEICVIAQDSCTGANQQYDSYDECYQFLTEQTRWGEALDAGYDTTWCRYVHRNMVPFRPDIHCPHIGRTGGDMCIDRDYLEVVNSFPFLQTLVAANTTWDNRDMASLSQKSIDELGKAKLTLVYPTTIAFFSVPTFAFFCILYFSAKLSEYLLYRYSLEYRLLTPVVKRNVVIYALNTLYTTIALIFQLIAAPALAHSYTHLGIQTIIITACMISANYVFEMIYRDSMRPSLLAHHLFTLLAIMSLFISIENNFHPATVTIGVIWLFQATTEQSIFIGLLMYRLKYNPKIVRAVLRFAAIQSFLVKFFFAVYLLVEHSLKLVQFTTAATDVYFSVIVYSVGMLLLTTQAYGSWAVWAISLKLSKQLKAGSEGSFEAAHEALGTTGFVNLPDEPENDSKSSITSPRM
ncbi:hypothetical protein JCM11641_004609 [Rhodosporidiobolus odoratus]